MSKSQGPGMHDAFTAAHWKQPVNSEMHCPAGDATGIILAMGELSTGRAAAVVFATVFAMLAAAWTPSRFVAPIRFSL